MSCFLCSPAHVAVLVESYASLMIFPAVYGIEVNKSAVARTLLEANYAAYTERYGDCEDVQGFELAFEEVVESIKDGVVAKLSLAATLKQWNCFEYQSEEWNDWDDSAAKSIVDMSRSALLAASPDLADSAEYESAAWGID